jgi:putative endonuclease
VTSLPLAAAQAAGGSGEDRAACFLERHGLAIAARNFRTRMGEIDLVAWDGGELVFVEVRSRASARFLDPAESVDWHKQRRLIAAARQYLALTAIEAPCRFDVVALEGEAPTWLKSAFSLSR